MQLIKLGDVAVIREGGLLVTDVSSALDLMATVSHETGCAALVLPKEAICTNFWVLSTQLAGAVLQKFINYHMKLAVVGDFSALTAQSKSLHDFLYESNQGRDFFFVLTEEEAVHRLTDVLI